MGRQTTRLLGTAGLALGLFSCESLRAGGNAEQPLWRERPSWALNVVYTKDLVARSREHGEPYQRGQPEIDARHRRVFVGSSDQGLYALDASDGRSLWRFETLGYVQCRPLYDRQENVLYFGSNEGALYKVKANTGELIWRFMTNAEVSQRPVLRDGLLYVVNANDTVLALDPTTGELRWSRSRTPAGAMEVAGYAGPLAWRNTIYAGFSDGTVSAFDARTGEPRWEPVNLAAEAEQLLGELPKYLDVDTTPVAYDGPNGPVVFVGSYAGGVHALDAETGTPVWHNPTVGGVADLMLWTQAPHAPLSGQGPDVEAREVLVAATGITGLWGLDPETGEPLWRQRLPVGGVSQPVPIAGALLVSASQLGLFLISPLDGSLIDGIHLADGVSMIPAAHGFRAFVLTNGGQFLGMHLSPPG